MFGVEDLRDRPQRITGAGALRADGQPGQDDQREQRRGRQTDEETGPPWAERNGGRLGGGGAGCLGGFRGVRFVRRWLLHRRDPAGQHRGQPFVGVVARGQLGVRPQSPAAEGVEQRVIGVDGAQVDGLVVPASMTWATTVVARVLHWLAHATLLSSPRQGSRCGSRRRYWASGAGQTARCGHPPLLS
ncbi:hypothetical protein PA7_21290 [Pseudonocardia asaccharolytica DSM 44247 = NBRC 16224]|uniref:Uncharacterized protein n=1 Tax=Pseudonocardia asaccharolytica DSM 44247 = NBRC 16224 TaxID=1123024 RepID=A0A511D0J1_9PSEU|nr:hypothetical protein [Pseudonocardia asaccharolytica]GEL18292.1 hypothetical protein PA7_21290 [Pseudonocardia asaccharolytica DSM 44247 = NBRC 16224]